MLKNTKNIINIWSSKSVQKQIVAEHIASPGTLYKLNAALSSREPWQDGSTIYFFLSKFQWLAFIKIRIFQKNISIIYVYFISSGLVSVGPSCKQLPSAGRQYTAACDKTSGFW